MAFSMATSKASCMQSARVAAPSRRPARAKRTFVISKGLGDKAKEAVESVKEFVSEIGPSPAQQGPDVNNVSGTPKGMGADAKDSNPAGRMEGKTRLKGDGPGKHTMVTKREAYLEGTKREEQKEKYMDKQDKKEAERKNSSNPLARG
jgi:hypothetical protein